MSMTPSAAANRLNVRNGSCSEALCLRQSIPKNRAY